jgi:hypothetical protein
VLTHHFHRNPFTVSFLNFYLLYALFYSICLERGIFKKHGINVTFRLVPEGTGAMLNLLENGKFIRNEDFAFLKSYSIFFGRSNAIVFTSTVCHL